MKCQHCGNEIPQKRIDDGEVLFCSARCKEYDKQRNRSDGNLIKHMRNNGYRESEIKKVQMFLKSRIASRKNIKLLDIVKCKCTKDKQCYICYLESLRDEIAQKEEQYADYCFSPRL